MSLKPSQIWAGEFNITDETGALVNADSLPTAILVRNGDDTAEVVTVTNKATGRYKFSVTIPAYTNGDRLQIFVPATISANNTGGIVAEDYLDSKLVGDLHDLSTADVLTQVTAGLTAFFTSVATLVAAVWAYATRTLTQGAASVTAAVTGSDITVYRGTTWSISLTGLGNLTAYNKVYFSVKRNQADSDEDALLRLSNAVGLERFNKAAATASDGSLNIDDTVAGDITLSVAASVTQNAPLGIFNYDVKGVDTDGNTVTLLSLGGTFTISADLTRTVA